MITRIWIRQLAFLGLAVALLVAGALPGGRAWAEPAEEPSLESIKTTLDEMEWQPVEGFPDVWMKFLGESLEDGPWVMQVRHGPNYVEAQHWHEADTFYIFQTVEMQDPEERPRACVPLGHP